MMSVAKIYDKHFKDGKPRKQQRENAKVEKAIKDKSTIAKVNKKLAKAGLPIQFAGKESKPAPVSDTTAKPVGIVDQVPKGNTGEKAGSRADLMDQARNAGIKYFRILNKEELQKVINGPANEVVKIIAQAKARWQKGWGSKNKEAKK